MTHAHRRTSSTSSPLGDGRDQLLTAEEAAEVLNIPRHAVDALLENGELAFEVRDGHRRIRLRDVLEFQASLRRERAEVLDEMQERAVEDGLYDLLDGPSPPNR